MIKKLESSPDFSPAFRICLKKSKEDIHEEGETETINTMKLQT